MMLSSTGSNVPHLPSLTIDRIRLLEKLQVATQRKLTLIVAPPGYGKTTLIAQYAGASLHPIAWHSVEEKERDLPNLVEHCLVALSAIMPNIQDIELKTGLPPREVATCLTDHLRNTLSTKIIYVMDDIHHLVGSSGCEEWLRAFIAGLPSTLHLILIGRTVPHLPLSEMIARREAQAIGQEDLRFTFHEVGELAKKAEQDLSAIEVQTTISRLNGWPAGTVLALQPLPSDIQDMLFNGRSGPEALFDSLAEIMLQAQISYLRDFLLASSTLNRMTPTACEGALRLSDSAKYLTEALNRSLFISPVSGGMIYHPLFRQFLQSRLKNQRPELYIRLHADAGHWFEADNRLDEAFEHYIAAELWSEAASIAERAAQTYLSQGKSETILHWRHQLSQTAVKTPRLHHTIALIHTERYEYLLARAALAKAAEDFQGIGEEDGLTKVTLLESTIHNRCGEYRQAIDLAAPIAYQASMPDNLRGYALSTLGIAHLQLGDILLALQNLEAALPLWRATSDAYSISQLLLSLQFAYTRLGRFTEAARCLQEVVSIRRALGSNVGLAMGLNNLGYQYHLLGDYDQALLAFQEGLQITSRTPETHAESYLLWSMGDLQRDRGAFAEADSFYRKSLQVIGGNEPALQCSVTVSLATLRRWEGELDDALSLGQNAGVLAEKYNLAIEQLRAEALVWTIHAQQGKAELAARQLDSIAESLQQRQAQARLIHTLGLCAYVALLNSNEAAAHEYLKSAITSVNHSANLQPLAAETLHSPLLKRYVLSHMQKYDSLIQEIQKLEHAQLKTDRSERKNRTPDPLPTYSLRVWTLGQERFERDGQIIPLSAWSAASARELFFFLLFQGAATREKIALEFWPDSSTHQVRKKFHTTLRRLRDASGANVVLFQDEVYCINPAIEIWCDAHEFEAGLQQARLTSPLIAHTENILRRTVDLYQGDFLIAYDKNWILAHREALHQEYLEALLALGQCVHIRGNPQEAINYFKRALTIDAYREDTYRALIRCYADIGERTLIRRLLENLTRLLRNELGVEPSIETLTLVQSALA